MIRTPRAACSRAALRVRPLHRVSRLGWFRSAISGYLPGRAARKRNVDVTAGDLRNLVVEAANGHGSDLLLTADVSRPDTLRETLRVLDERWPRLMTRGRHRSRQRHRPSAQRVPDRRERRRHLPDRARLPAGRRCPPVPPVPGLGPDRRASARRQAGYLPGGHRRPTSALHPARRVVLHRRHRARAGRRTAGGGSTGPWPPGVCAGPTPKRGPDSLRG